MPKHVTDSERLVIAALNRRETELQQTREDLDQLKTQLKKANKILCAQVRYLDRKKVNHD